MFARKFVAWVFVVGIAMPSVLFADARSVPAGATVEPADLITLAMLGVFVLLGAVSKRNGRRE